MALFDAIQTIDREKLARALAKEMAEQGRRPRLFIQVNTGEEEQKAGVAPARPTRCEAVPRRASARDRGADVHPAADEEPALHFALLAKIAERNGLTGLSMGMSGDFETAIAFGATHVRVGSAIFGDRPAL